MLCCDPEAGITLWNQAVKKAAIGGNPHDIASARHTACDILALALTVARSPAGTTERRQEEAQLQLVEFYAVTATAWRGTR